MFLTQSTRLKKVQAFFTKYWFILMGGAILLALVTALALLWSRPNSTTTTTPPLTQQGNPDGSQTEFMGITFSGTAPTVPEKMWLADVMNYNQSNNQELLDSLITAYELQPSPYVQTVWVGPEYSLEYDPNSSELRLGKKLLNPTSPPSKITPSTLPQLVAKANTAAKTIFPSVPFVSFPDKTQLLVGGAEFSPATTDDATHIQVPFGPSFYQIPVVLQYDRALPMMMYLDAKGIVTKIVARPFTAEFKASTQHPTLSIQEALQEIERGNASIIDSYSETTVTPKLDKVVRGEFTNATLEYRIDPDTNSLIPYYHFVGTLVNYDNDIFAANVITPAVRLD